MGRIFDRDRSVIVRHIRNIYETKELSASLTCAKNAQIAADGKIRRMDVFSLDMIIAVGYRVNSRQGTQFRIWATQVLRDHLLKGYTVNEKRLQEQVSRLKELQETVDLLGRVIQDRQLTDTEAEGLPKLSLIIRWRSPCWTNTTIRNWRYVIPHPRLRLSWFLDANRILYRKDGTKRLADNALVALAKRLKKATHKNTDLEVLKDVIRAHPSQVTPSCS